MNTAYFIAGHMRRGGARKGFSRLIRVIALLSISLSLTVMIVSMAVVTGFQNEIRGKVIGFGSHIQITGFDYSLTTELKPISKHQEFLEDLNKLKGVEHIQVFAHKAGIIKTDTEIHGLVMKGVGSDYDWRFFSDNLVSGKLPDVAAPESSNEVMLSSWVARRLNLQAGDEIFMYFIQEPPRIRRYTITALYNTGLEEFDRIFMIGDIRQIQRLNDWQEDQIGGFEVQLSRYNDIESVTGQIYEIIPYDLDTRSIRQIYPQIFDWLALLDMNVVVILVLMLVVAAINMITTLLISVLEQTSLVGILKALGAANVLVRRVFLYHAAMLIAKGLIIGNATGLMICFMQKWFGIIKLPSESYYVTEVPVNIEAIHIMALNLGTFVICMALLLLPSMVITRITPVKAIRFR